MNPIIIGGWVSMSDLSNKTLWRKIPYIIILFLAVLSIFQYMDIREYREVIYNHNIASYNQVEFELFELRNNLLSPNIANEKKAELVMTNNERIYLNKNLEDTYYRIHRSTNYSLNPINKKSKSIKLIISKLEFALGDVMEQFKSAENINYLDAREFIDKLDSVKKALETELTLGNNPDITLTDEKTENIIKTIDEFAKYNINNQ
jgi:hypothetical protein